MAGTKDALVKAKARILRGERKEASTGWVEVSIKGKMLRRHPSATRKDSALYFKAEGRKARSNILHARTSEGEELWRGTERRKGGNASSLRSGKGTGYVS